MKNKIPMRGLGMIQRLDFAKLFLISGWLILGGAMAMGFIPGCQEDSKIFTETAAQSPLKDSNKGRPIYQLQEAFHEVFDLYKDSVVFISTEKTVRVPRHPFFNDPFFQRHFGQQQIPQTQKQTGLGTGFIVSGDGYICTNNHVIADMDSVKVKIGEKQYEAKVIGADELSDIALLKIDGVSDLKPVHFGNSDQVQVGDWSIAIGNPFGLDKTFTVGVISAIARERVDESGNAHIQTDASINPGNSGGPLINIDGEVIGVNRMIYSQSGGNMGIGFAIPINIAKATLDELRKNGKVSHGYLGVHIAPMNPALAQHLGIKRDQGVLVVEIIQGSPAAKAGIKKNDIITKAGGEVVENPATLIRQVRKTPVGGTLDLEIIRAGKQSKVSVRIAEQPAK